MHNLMLNDHPARTHTDTHVITLEQTAIIKQTFKVCLKILYYLSLSRLIKLNHCFNFTITVLCVYDDTSA